jgi:hypothetical protein
MDLARIQKIIKNKVNPSSGIAQEIEYTKSPIYKRRLEKAGVKDVDELISKRVSALEKTKTQKATQFQSNATGGGQSPVITMEEGMSPYTLQHEIVHASKGGGESIESYGSPYKAKGTQMSPAESWMFYNRNKNLSQKMKGSGKTMKEEMYAQYTQDPSLASQSYYNPDIAKSMYGKQFPTEMHKISAQENAGDLGAFRKILFDKGITKKYGDDINMSKIQKALKNPSIKKEPHVKRLLESFDEKSLIELNNAVAGMRKDKNENQA